MGLTFLRLVYNWSIKTGFAARQNQWNIFFSMCLFFPTQSPGSVLQKTGNRYIENEVFFYLLNKKKLCKQRVLRL